MNRNKRKYLIYLFVFSLVFFMSLALFAPYYLTYTDVPLKSDVIILLAGANIEAKKKEAHRLINKGQATHLIIPSRKNFLHKDPNGILTDTTTDEMTKQVLSLKLNNSNNDEYDKVRWRFERTHIEVMAAKEMMQARGFTSAIFMSHPYHMRRIKLIAARVFNEKDFRLYFVPARYEKFNKNKWWISKDDRQWVLSEYTKIAWFLLYTYVPFLISA